MKRESKRQSNSYNIQNTTSLKVDSYQDSKESLAHIQIFVGGINHRIDKGTLGLISLLLQILRGVRGG